MIEVLLVLINFTGGVPHVNMHLVINGAATVQLPMVPIVDTILVMSSSGELIPSIYYPNNTLVVFALNQGEITISYLGNYTVSDGIYSAHVNYSTGATLVFPPNVIPLGVPVLNFTIINKELWVSTPPGNYTVKYVVILPTRPTPGGSPSNPQPQPIRYMPGLGLPLYIVIVIAAASVAYLVLTRRGGSSVSLNDTERLVIDVLKSHGGSLYFSELQRLTNIPRTTLLRTVKRLESLGYVKVMKDGGVNRVVLRKTQ